MDALHRPVLSRETLALLDLRPGSRVLDGTLGDGGHSEAILEATAPDGLVVGLDRDPTALRTATARLARFGDRLSARHGRFGDMVALTADVAPFDAVLLDVGVRSAQLDQPSRGFSFQSDGPVDMRMDPDAPTSAAALLDELDEERLTRIIGEYGEEPRARRIARAVLAGRPWTSTTALAACVAAASGYHGSRTHPATRTFQALRIAVNDELGELERALDALPRVVRPGGRAAIITFHSLEDRLVKHCMRAWAGMGTPRDAWGNPVTRPIATLLTRGIAGADADPTNPRARSARLRGLQFIDASAEAAAEAGKRGAGRSPTQQQQ